MKVLAIDTSNHPMSVALVQDKDLMATTTLNMVRNHSIYLMPTIDNLMKDVGWQPADLDRVVVAQGPGSYTGVRIAVTTAKTLALTLNLSLVGISSLATIAYNTLPTTTGLIVPFFDARRGNVFAGVYQWVDGRLVNKVPDAHLGIDELLTQLAGQDQAVTMLGHRTRRIDAKIESVPANVTFAPRSFGLPSTYRLALAGEKAAVVTNLDNFVPHYLRITEAEAQWQKKHPGETRANYVREV